MKIFKDFIPHKILPRILVLPKASSHMPGPCNPPWSLVSAVQPNTSHQPKHLVVNLSREIVAHTAVHPTVHSNLVPLEDVEAVLPLDS